MSDGEVIYPGRPGVPGHQDYLLELGRATYAAAGVAGIAFDLLRVFGGVDSSVMYNDPLGRLEKRLSELAGRREDWPDLAAFVDQLGRVRLDRNDLLHSQPVLHGLYRRRTDDEYYEREFFTVESLSELTATFEELRRRGNELLYHDGGAAIRAWYASTDV